MAADDPIALHWWKAVPNFGDAISAMVVAHVSGRPVTHAGAGKADLFAIGSIIQVARRAHQEARADGVKPWIWGRAVCWRPSPWVILQALTAPLPRHRRPMRRASPAPAPC